MILSALVFLSVTLAAVGLYLWLAPDRAQQRLRALQEPQAGHWQASLVKVAAPLAKLSTPQGDWETSPLRIRFLQAGLRSERARLHYFGAKTALPLVLGVLSYVLLAGGQLSWQQTLMGTSVAALLGTYLPNAVLLLAVRARRREILEAFADASDLLLVCMEAGLGLDAAFSRVAEELRLSSPALSEELHLTNLEMRAGASREQALHHLALRSGVDEVATFALMIKQADRFGTSISESLRVYSEELRHKRMTRAETRAAKVPTLLLVPLVLCIFPAIMMVVLGPAGIRIVRQLLPMLGGQV